MITTKIYQKLFEKYGNTPCREIMERVEAELSYLQKRNYLDYLDGLDCFVETVKKANEPYCAIRLTSASFVLNILDITACNPLPPHYHCPKCRKAEFIPIKDGFDLREKECECGGIMQGDGHNIPAEQLYGRRFVKHPFVFHISEAMYKILPEFFPEFREEPFREVKIGIANRLCAFFINDYIHFKDKKISYSNILTAQAVCEASKAFLNSSYGIEFPEGVRFSDILFEYGRHSGRRSDEDASQITNLFREDLLRKLLDRGALPRSANLIISHVLLGHEITEEIKSLLSDEEICELSKVRSMPNKSLCVEWMCYMGRSMGDTKPDSLEG